MREVLLDTDPRPVEASVTGPGGMEASGDVAKHVSAALRWIELAKLRDDVPYVWGAGHRRGDSVIGQAIDNTKLPDRVDAFRLALSVIPPAQRCRGVLVEGI